jgi:sulfite reductase beta subunit
VNEIVGRILESYRTGGKPWERMGEWIERIGWKKFFQLTNLTFDKDMIDDYRHGRESYNTSAHIRF